jgi:hypothetical protein
LGCELLVEGVLDSRLLATREGRSYIMEHVLCEPVELTEFELDAVAGGNPFSINVEAAFSKVRASVRASFENESTNSITNLIDNSVNVSGP